MTTKRDKAHDRESGTGNPIKSIPSKGGSGKGNWGSDQEQIKQGMDSLNEQPNATSKRSSNEPNSFGDLNEMEEANKPKQSWDEFNKNKKKAEVYKVKSVKSDYRKKYKPNAYEKETDAMFAGSGKGKRARNKQKKKKKKVLLQTAVHYNEEKKNRNTGRGAGGYNNMRGGGYRGGRGGGGYNNQSRGGGGYGGGYSNQRGGGFNRRGGGFGSRGRGFVNTDYDNQQNYQNQNTYQPQQSNGQQQPPQPQSDALPVQ